MPHEDKSNSILEALELDAKERKTRLGAIRNFTCTELFLLGTGVSSFGLAAALGFQIPHLASSFSVAFLALALTVAVFALRKIGIWGLLRRSPSTVINERSSSLSAWLHYGNQYAQEIVTRRGFELSRYSLASLTKAKREIEFTVDNIKNHSSTASAFFGLLALLLLSGPQLLSLSFPNYETTTWTEIYRQFDLSPLTAALIGLAFIRVAFHFRQGRLIQHKYAITYAIDLIQTDKDNI